MQTISERPRSTSDAGTGLFDYRLIAAMRDALGQTNLDELLDLLLTDLGTRPGKIAQAAIDQDCHALRREAHLLLGAVQWIGAVALADCLVAIENAARQQKIARDGMGALARDAVRLHAAIVEYRRAA